ncbi:hypothetical protein [Providencia phage vB_PreS-PatoteraRojo]|nr:hypothetical protein [Providencia phage vB_PreS-PatoteraRojo]
MDIITKLTFDYNNIDFHVNVICLNEDHTFNENWRMTDEHEGGVTVQNLDADRGSYRYAVPLYTSVAEQVQTFRDGGASNPSAEAYAHLQRVLRRDLNASDYCFSVSAFTKDGKIQLINNEFIGHSFNYSYHDSYSLEEIASSELVDIKGEIIERAVECAKEMISGIETVSAFIAAQEKDDLI